jgi:hypothetical protein
VFVALQNSAPVGEGFWVVRTRCKIAPPVEDSLTQRAVNLYSALEATFAAPKYNALIEDALMQCSTAFIHSTCRVDHCGSPPYVTSDHKILLK